MHKSVYDSRLPAAARFRDEMAERQKSRTYFDNYNWWGYEMTGLIPSGFKFRFLHALGFVHQSSLVG
jgi:hypothetical protein